MITEDSRSCEQCHTPLPVEEAVACPVCGCVLCPSHAAWPRAMKRWLLLRLALDFFAPWARNSNQTRWERLLASKMRGRQWGTRILSHSATRRECYDLAVKEVAAWEASGSPGIEKLAPKHAA